MPFDRVHNVESGRIVHLDCDLDEVILSDVPGSLKCQIVCPRNSILFDRVRIFRPIEQELDLALVATLLDDIPIRIPQIDVDCGRVSGKCFCWEVGIGLPRNVPSKDREDEWRVLRLRPIYQQSDVEVSGQEGRHSEPVRAITQIFRFGH